MIARLYNVSDESLLEIYGNARARIAVYTEKGYTDNFEYTAAEQDMLDAEVELLYRLNPQSN